MLGNNLSKNKKIKKIMNNIIIVDDNPKDNKNNNKNKDDVDVDVDNIDNVDNVNETDNIDNVDVDNVDVDNADVDNADNADNVDDTNNADNADNVNNTQIIQPCPIPKFVNIEILKKFVEKDINGNKEYFDDLKITYKISDPKKAEWILNKAIDGGKLVGNGNTSIDIEIQKNNTGIDVSVLTLNGNNTNEKSIMQSFLASSDLDSLFNNNKGTEAVNIFKDKLKIKYQFDNISDIYYLIFICKSKNIYLACLKLNLKNIGNMKFASFTKSCKNITIDNFIDKKYGNVKLYKSKKRLELRLSKNIINDDCCIKLF